MIVRTVVLLLLILAPARITAVQDVTPADDYGIERVIVISLDGARPDAIWANTAPHMQGLAARGAVAWTASTVYPSVTLPAHASMLTGLSIAEHGLDHNDSLYPCPRIAAPTFLTITAAADQPTAMVVGKERLCQLAPEGIDYTFAREGDRSVVDRVIELLDADFTVIFAHFPNPDYFGHLTGWMSDIYLRELRRTDDQVGRLLAALDDRALTASTLIILTADHGGLGTTHGRDIPEDMLIPWMIAGPGVTPGVDLGALGVEISVADTAHTVLWALGLPTPESALGRPVVAAFASAAR
ncbi:MAG: sulfatase-like hydrolase/transferase [Chloroflexi bacterium]|nr:sulfatase-like hydrolase/transferase [Chloroflexota bacterium]